MKPSNILISEDGHVKISDFGIAKLITTTQQTQTKIIGTLAYMAPEMFDEKEQYNEKVDVFSFGVIMYFMLNQGSLPNMRYFLRGKEIKIPDTINEFSKQLITECWSFEPEDRPSFENICERLRASEYNIINLDKSQKSTILQKVQEHDQTIKFFLQ